MVARGDHRCAWCGDAGRGRSSNSRCGRCSICWRRPISPRPIPKVLQKTFRSGGENFVFGWQNWLSDWMQLLSAGKPARDENFVVGKTVATSRGKVVFRNDLIELIQYSPATDKVHPEPILIVPAWIMKYYILDLSPQNSLVKYLTERRLHRLHDLLAQSRAGGSRDRLRRLSQARRGSRARYRRRYRAGSVKFTRLGYCLGGTLLSIAAAAMARDGDDQVEVDHAARGADRFHRSRRTDAVHQRKPGRVSRRHDVGTRLPRHHADGGRLPAAALERSDLVAARPATI